MQLGNTSKLAPLAHEAYAPGTSSHSTKLTMGVPRLKVVQQPLRARMCGFGDKVRWQLLIRWYELELMRYRIVGLSLLHPALG